MSIEIKFRKTKEYYGCFSNFSRHPVVFRGKIYPTSEHLYQSLKFKDPLLQEKIRMTDSPKQAAIFGRSLPNMREDWDNIKLAIMYEVVRLKIEQHEEVESKLIESDNAVIIEDAPWDSFWGNGEKGDGQNWLGRIYMLHRSQITFGAFTAEQSLLNNWQSIIDNELK